MALMLEPPPSTFPIDMGTARSLRCGFGSAANPQSRSLPIFIAHWAASTTFGWSSLPPVSSRSTLTSTFSARRRATTDPEEPEPHTIKS